MAKTVKYPPLVVVSGNETLLELSVTDAYVSAGASVRGLLVLLTYHVAGDTITFSWNGKEVTFTCVASYTGLPLTYPVRVGGETMPSWGEKIFRIIASNYALTSDFMITGQPNVYEYRIYFVPFEKTAQYNLTIESTGYTDIVNSSYSASVLYENYKLQLQLLKETTESGITMFTKTRSAVYPPFFYQGLNASLKYDIARLVYTDTTGHFTFPESGVRHVQNIIEKFYLQLSFIADNIAGESFPVTQFFYALPGKMSKTKEKALNTGNTSLYAELVSSKRFLSYAPLTKKTDVYAPEKLYFLFTAAYAGAIIRITERFSNANAETRTLDTFAAAAFSLHEFSVGFQTIKQADYGEKILTDYDIWIENGSGGLVSERRNFQMDYSYQRMARYFYFKNSFGVYELIRTTGDAVKTNKVDKEFYERVVHGKKDRDQTRKIIDINQTLLMKINSGYMEDPWNFYYASEFLASEDVYWLKNDRPYAVQVESSEVDPVRSDMDNLHDFDFLVTLDDMDDSFYQEFLPGSELPVQGDFNNDFGDDFNV